MQPIQLLQTLQLMDSFFPVGAFAYSDGLETAASEGHVKDAASLQDWMDHFVDAVFVSCEGLALVKAMAALQSSDHDALRELDTELTAIRPASAVRAASTGVGKRLLSAYASISGSEHFNALARLLPHANAATAYALVFFHRGVSEREAALSFGYNRLAGIVSAGLRLISIGQQQGQALLTRGIERLPAAVDRILLMKGEPLRSFSPMLDIQQMNHRYVYSRLFRS
jgi:urease accessory protein